MVETHLEKTNNRHAKFKISAPYFSGKVLHRSQATLVESGVTSGTYHVDTD